MTDENEEFLCAETKYHCPCHVLYISGISLISLASLVLKQERPIIVIPRPCSQDWESMTPDGCGRHCGACQKTVIDFTAMTDGEILKHNDAMRAGNVCGRIHASQLNRELRPEPRVYAGYALYKKITAAVLLLQALSADVWAQVRAKKPVDTVQGVNGIGRQQAVDHGGVFGHVTGQRPLTGNTTSIPIEAGDIKVLGGMQVQPDVVSLIPSVYQSQRGAAIKPAGPAPSTTAIPDVPEMLVPPRRSIRQWIGDLFSNK